MIGGMHLEGVKQHLIEGGFEVLDMFIYSSKRDVDNLSVLVNTPNKFDIAESEKQAHDKVRKLIDDFVNKYREKLDEHQVTSYINEITGVKFIPYQRDYYHVDALLPVGQEIGRNVQRKLHDLNIKAEEKEISIFETKPKNYLVLSNINSKECGNRYIRL